MARLGSEIATSLLVNLMEPFLVLGGYPVPQVVANEAGRDGDLLELHCATDFHGVPSLFGRQASRQRVVSQLVPVHVRIIGLADEFNDPLATEYAIIAIHLVP